MTLIYRANDGKMSAMQKAEEALRISEVTGHQVTFEYRDKSVVVDPRLTGEALLHALDSSDLPVETASIS